MKEKLAALGYSVLTDPKKQETIAKGANKFVDDSKTLYLMVKDYISGEYTLVPKTAIVIAAGALVYVVSPDLIPGPLDDALVISTAIAVLGEDIKSYRKWKSENEKVTEVVVTFETGKKFVIKGELVPLHISDRLKEIGSKEESNDERTSASDSK